MFALEIHRPTPREINLVVTLESFIITVCTAKVVFLPPLVCEKQSKLQPEKFVERGNIRITEGVEVEESIQEQDNFLLDETLLTWPYTIRTDLYFYTSDHTL